ncbi:MAG: EAL domain-containing protein [Thiobacillus sp.]|nr:EAL domain-containing protein [Thiobacillus sp.]
MQRIFSPAIFMLNRLNYTKKFTLLWVVSLIAIGVMVYSLIVNLERVIQPSQQRLEGLALIEPVTRATQALQLHRGLSAAFLGGNTSMRDRRAAQEKIVADALGTLEEKLPHSLTGTEDYRRIRTDWTRLQKEGLALTVADNLAAHTGLIEHLQFLEQLVSEQHLLVMDTDIAAYYLVDIATNRLMRVLEQLGRLRAYGTGALTRNALTGKRLDEDQRVELRLMMAGLDDAMRHFNLGTESVERHNPAIHSALQAVSRDIDNSVRQVTGLVATDILSGRFALPPETFLNAATEQIDRSYAQLYDALLPMARSLAQAHIDRAKNELFASLGIALLVLLLAVYLSVSFYYAIVGSIQMIARCARTFAGGDLNTRIQLGTRDELSQVGDSFNEMADGLKALLETHREDKARLRAILDSALDAVVQMNREGIITGWSSQAENIFGWSREEALGRVLSETIIPPQYREAHTQGLKRFLFAGEGTILNPRFEVAGLHRDGHEFPVELSITAVNTAGECEFNGFIRDITQQKESEELIWKQANFDTLTGLPNRHMFHDRMVQEIKKADRAELEIGLLFIDLDKFKEVNDTLGHTMGDILLQEAARRIGGCVRETDTVARLGGDEFIVILAELGDTGSVERVAGNIRQSLAKPFLLKNEMVYISTSIGITLYPNDATNVDDLLKNADQAMYAAKNEGRNRFSYFTPAMQQSAQARLRLTNELRGALEAKQFKIYYQPIVDLATGRIHKAEALIRWLHPELGMVSPAQLIPLAEESGLIVEIGDWVFKESARQLKHWEVLYNSRLQVSVNLSPAQFGGVAGCLSKAWLVYLQELELPAQSLVVEITEGLLLNSETGVTDELLGFHEAGIQIAIDDFGTGYSSLSYLKKFDIDYLKIDQSFVRDLVIDSNDRALSEAIIVMAHKLGLKVIAEGVETEAQRALLTQAGCDYAQGFLFSRPLPADEFEALLKGLPPGCISQENRT